MSRVGDLRRAAGLAERRVWARLRRGGVGGFKVRRQHPIGPWIADFACAPLLLVIEIDGGVHEREEVAMRDHLRQTDIEARGWTVLRFSNDTALAEPWRIDDAIRERARAMGLM